MAKDEMKYACGCGKHYLSYPAYIAHRKGKHNNETVAGTVLPQTFKTKRGRPSFNYLHKELQG